MKDEAKKWLKQANVDLNTARNSMNSKDYYASAFWCQQAVEKGLKGFLIEKFGELIKIHDLVILGRKVNLPENFLNDCEKLSKVYIESRYGIIDDNLLSDKFNKKDCIHYLEIAGGILTWLKGEI